MKSDSLKGNWAGGNDNIFLSKSMANACVSLASADYGGYGNNYDGNYSGGRGGGRGKGIIKFTQIYFN